MAGYAVAPSMMISGSPVPHAVNAITVPSADTAAALTFSVIGFPPESVAEVSG